MTKDEALKLAFGEIGRLVETGKYNGQTIKTMQAIKEALAQPEQHQDWCASLTQMLMSMPPKPAPCNCKPPQRKPLTDEEIWVLTSEYNDYDQHGEYFEAVFIGKPTSKQIQKHCHVTEQGAVHILNGGGRVKYEDQWYNLRKEKAAHGIKGEA